MTNVSRFTVVRADGQAMCACGKPVERTRETGGRGRPQSQCNACHAADMRARRAGTTQMQLTPEERQVILDMRRAGR